MRTCNTTRASSKAPAGASRALRTVAAQLGVDVCQRAQRERVVLVGKAALRLRDLLHPLVQLRGLAQRGLAAAPPGGATGLLCMTPCSKGAPLSTLSPLPHAWGRALATRMFSCPFLKDCTCNLECIRNKCLAAMHAASLPALCEVSHQTQCLCQRTPMMPQG